MYRRVKAEKPWVKVGISPFGIWRPGHPEGIQGFDAYAQLYADAKKWLQEGWVDYITPQLYWAVDSEGQSYPQLLAWWDAQNSQSRHLWPGNFASRVLSDQWSPDELLRQIAVTREQAGATGNVHFSMKALLPENAGLGEALQTGPYATPAAVPASPWLDDQRPARPQLELARSDGTRVLRMASSEQPWMWAIQESDEADGWTLRLLPGSQTEVELGQAEEVAVSALSRTGIQSRVSRLDLSQE
jgi:uncharacterized lipoprotein YddW (UPF0748 family)